MHRTLPIQLDLHHGQVRPSDERNRLDGGRQRVPDRRHLLRGSDQAPRRRLHPLRVRPDGQQDRLDRQGTECVIGGACYAAAAKHATGCLECNSATSATSWTPVSGCQKIIFAALNSSRNGDLGGVTAADAACQADAQAAGFPGTWKAFLSDSSRDVKSLISGANASGVPVVTLQNEQMYTSWDSIFTCTTTLCYWSSAASPLWTFEMKAVNSALGYDGDGWHGSNPDGTAHPDRDL